MKRLDYLLIFAFFSIPIWGVALLALAAYTPHLDPITLHTPMPVRSLVANIAMEIPSGWGKLPLWDRAIKLDPTNVEAWSRRCDTFSGNGPQVHLENCQRWVALDRTAGSLRGLAITQEAAKQSCLAESTLRDALTKPDVDPQRVFYLVDLGHNAFVCGDVDESLRAYLEAEKLYAGDTARSESDDVSLSLVRAQLSVIYSRLGQLDLARKLCDAAAPKSKSPRCEDSPNGQVLLYQ